MSFISSMMRRVLDGMSPEEKREFIDEITEEMFQNMTGEQIKDIMSVTMPKILEKSIISLGADQVNELMKKMMPAIIEKCFSKMNGEQMNKMMSICRNALDTMEEKMVSGSRA
ncbi:MAG: hypothetical protein NWF11_04675 [Candidatus Bathyarchaeota archaeon]|nr:hypothetical protein [Candidatus Bathyarchaeota archaeon]